MQAALTGVPQGDASLEWFLTLLRAEWWTAKRRKKLSADERHLAQLVEALSGDVADELLGSEDLEDFEERLDRVVSRGWFLATRILLVKKVAKLGPSFIERMGRDLAQAAVSDFLVDLLGEGVRRDAERVDGLLAAYAGAMAELVAIAPDELLSVPDDDVSALRRLAFSISVPAPIRRAVEGGLKADACLLTVVAMATDEGERSAEPWLRKALAATAADELYPMVKLLASVPGASVPDDVVPTSERLDLEALEKEQERLERCTASIYDGVARHGTPFAPYGPPLLDD